MSRSLIVELTGLQRAVPASKVFSEFLFELTLQNGVAVVKRTPDISAQFDNLENGLYSVKVTGYWTDRTTIGPPIVGEILIGAPETGETIYFAPTGLVFQVL